jgi:hypothetical protein
MNGLYGGRITVVVNLTQLEVVVNRALNRVRRGAAVWLTLAVTACATDATLTGPEPTVQSSVASLQDVGPTLLSCPTNTTTTASRRIGPAGGVLTLAGTKLRVPAGAVAAETEFVITIPASPYLELDISATGHEHYRFASPVTVTVNYARCKSKQAEIEALSAWHIDASTRDFLEDMGGIESKAGRKITFDTDHLSGYAIAW